MGRGEDGTGRGGDRGGRGKRRGEEDKEFPQDTCWQLLFHNCISSSFPALMLKLETLQIALYFLTNILYS